MRINRIIRHLPQRKTLRMPAIQAPQTFAAMPMFFLAGMSPAELAARQNLYLQAYAQAKAAATPELYRRLFAGRGN